MNSRFPRAILVGLLAGLLCWTIARTRTDVDLWGHIRFGLDILDTHALHERDPYSFTSDRPWINHEWLSEVVLAAAWRAGGSPALIAVKLACTFGALAMIAAAFRERGIAGHPRVILLGLTLLGILPRIAQVRPQLFSVLLFAALARVFVRVDRGDTRALLWTIPIMTLWANSHGGWLVGVATVTLWCAGEAWALRAEPAKVFLALGCAAAAAAATLLNPYGMGLWSFLLETVRFGREAIREWGPAWTDPATTIVWILFALLLIGAFRRTSWPRNPATVLIPIVWGAAALRVGRLDAFFAMSVVSLLAVPASLLFESRAADRSVLPRAWRFAAVALAAAILLAVPASRRAFTCIGFLDPRWPEPQAVERIQELKLSGRIVTYFDWGEYAIWHLAPALKVSMDGRRETVYSNRVIDGHLQLYAGTPQGFEYLEELDPDYVWLPRGLPIVPLLQQKGWVTLFAGPRSTLFAGPGANTGAVREIALADGSAARCFPGP